MLKDIRQQMVANERVQETYNKMIQQAETFLETNLKPIDEVKARMVGVCDWYRTKYPNRISTDKEILDYIDMLEEKYKDC